MILIIMGVSGAGKTTTGKLLAQQLGWQYAEGDDFHPPENVEKMSRGVPLEDSDRSTWLSILRKAIDQWLARGENVVLTCSALKQKYRDELAAQGDQVRFVYLKVSFEMVKERMSKRTNHFMPLSLLDSQFQILEEPTDQIAVNAGESADQVVNQIRARLHLLTDDLRLRWTLFAYRAMRVAMIFMLIVQMSGN